MQRVIASLVLALVIVSPVAARSTASTTATLTASFPNGTAYGVQYVVSGCGYQPGVPVTVAVQSPEAYSFAGEPADVSGCISIDNFQVQGPGTYFLQAWQSNPHHADATYTFSL